MGNQTRLWAQDIVLRSAEAGVATERAVDLRRGDAELARDGAIAFASVDHLHEGARRI